MSSGVLKYTLVVRHPETSTAVALLAGEEVPEWASDLVQADDLVGGDESSDGYGSLKVADLKAEIEKRNVDRDDDKKLSTEGLKADLIAVLVADDPVD